MEGWYKIDNAGKLFPAVQNSKNSSVYRMSAVMDSEINIPCLQMAVDTVTKRFPMFMVKLRKGVFWNYLEENIDNLIVKEESEYPCSKILLQENNDFLLKVLYYKNRISVEFFHVLADGYGASEFMKSLLFYYLKYCGNKINPEGKILLEDDGIDTLESEDSFKKYSRSSYYETFKNNNAYHIKGSTFPQYGFNVVHGIVDASLLNKVAKKYNATITSYLTALLIYSIYKARISTPMSELPIVTAVPVNLRKIFPSKTLRNFFGVVNIGSIVSENTTLEELIVYCDKMLRHKTSIYHLQNLICSNVALEKIKFAKPLPLFIKNMFISYGFNMFGEKRKSISLSNIGNITLPEDMYKYINQFEALLYPTPQSPINCGICSVNNRLTISFTRSIDESDILQYFFSYLATYTGLSIEIYSNDWGDTIE